MKSITGSSISAAGPRALRLTVAAALLLSVPLRAAEEWTDISSPLLERLSREGAKPEWPGGCSGVVVNRTTGAVTIKVVGHGLWRSEDQGKNWARVDGKTISGRDETGWATGVDQGEPARMASFSLDGNAGWTPDGKNWKPFTALGRNWDFGSVDWNAPEPLTIIAAKHETDPPGEVYASDDGGVTWNQLAVHLTGKQEGISMIGALARGIFIYSNGGGIFRSVDAGKTWLKVSAVNPQTRIPVFFRGVHYLGSANGLLASRDLGATWQESGKVDVRQGPFFGRNEKEMAVAGKQGIFLTKDAGLTWNRAADLKSGSKQFSFNPNWFGCYGWDPVNRVIYASAMGNPVFRLALPRAPE